MASGSLKSMAIDALATYICEMSEHATVDICQRLGPYLSESIPHTLANEVTAKLLSCLNRKFKKECQCQELVETVILPTVTKLDFHPYRPHSHKLYKDHWYCSQIVLPIVLRRLDKLPNLKMLRLEWKDEPYDDITFFPSSLVELTFHFCNIETLESISECCKLLRKLHIPLSRYGTYDFIKLISTFKHLEDLNLNGVRIFKGPYFPSELKLIKRMPKATILQLKKFGCSVDSASEFAYLVQNFLQLTHLTVQICSCKSDLFSNCKLLANWKHLKSLVLVNFVKEAVDPILDVIGSQLTHLKLKLLEPCDLCKVVEKCPSVQCLHINSGISNMPVPSAERLGRLPPLKHLECVSLKFHYKPDITARLMSICKNVKVLKILTFSDDEIITSTILNEEPMIALKQLSWYSENATREKVLKIVEHCPNLEILRGSYVWSRHGNEALKEENYLLSNSTQTI